MTADAVARSLAGVTIRELSATEWGQYVVDLQLQRANHDEALNEIFLAFQQLGFSLVEATVSEWVNAAVEGAVLGTLGCGAVGSTSQDAGIMLLAGAAGAIAGAWAGSRVKDLKVNYQVRRVYPSGWVLRPIPQDQQTGRAFRPGFSPG